MEQYVTRIGDVTIQRVIPSGGGPPEPVRVMDGEELLRAVKEEPIDEDEEETEEESAIAGDEDTPMEGEDDKVNEKDDPDDEEAEEEDDEEEKIIIKAEPQDQDELLGDDNDAEQRPTEDSIEDDQLGNGKEEDEEEDKTEKDKSDEYLEEKDKETGECSKRKADNDAEDDEDNTSKKKKVEIDVDIDKKKISNLRRNIREVMDETQLDEATLSAQRQEAERLRRVQDQQKYIREVQRQIQLNRQNSKTQSRVISLLQGGSTSILKSSSVSSTTTATSTGPSTVLVKVGSGQQQVLNRKTLEVLRGGKSVSSSTDQIKSGISRVATGAKPGMVTPSVSIAPVKPVIQGDTQKKDAGDPGLK